MEPKFVVDKESGQSRAIVKTDEELAAEAEKTGTVAEEVKQPEAKPKRGK